MILLIYTFLKVHLILKQRRQILPLGHRQLAMFVMSALMLCSRATMPAFHNGVEIFFDVSFTISYQPVWIRIRNNIQIKKVKYCNWKKENFPIRKRKIFQLEKGKYSIRNGRIFQLERGKVNKVKKIEKWKKNKKTKNKLYSTARASSWWKILKIQTWLHKMSYSSVSLVVAHLLPARLGKLPTKVK